VDKSKVANQVWETLFQDRRKISSRESHQELESTGIRSNNQSKKKRNSSGKTIRETTKEHSEKNKSL
jgi:hypothetical protein